MNLHNLILELTEAALRFEEEAKISYTAKPRNYSSYYTARAAGEEFRRMINLAKQYG